MSARIFNGGYDLHAPLVLRTGTGMSARIPHDLNDLHTQLVLRDAEQDSAQVAQKVAAHHAEFLLGEVPRKTRERRGKGERIDGEPRVGSDRPALHTVRREVVRIAAAPRSLRPYAPRRLAGRRGARPLTSPDTSVGHEPATTDAARALPEHPPMLYASQGFGGPLLESRPLSFLESGEATRAVAPAASGCTEATDTRQAEGNRRLVLLACVMANMACSRQRLVTC
jgi:hypothetical protein